MDQQQDINIYLDTPISRLFDDGHIDKTVLRACQAAKPPMETAGDVLAHLHKYGNFARVPGCRRPGRIPDTLLRIAEVTHEIETPIEEKPVLQKRKIAGELDANAEFDFLSEVQRAEVLKFRGEFGHLPMFTVLKIYLNRADASRNDKVMAFSLGMRDDAKSTATLADIAGHVNLSRERVRQIAMTYSLPDILMHPRLWTGYADHSTYFMDASHPSYKTACDIEVPGLAFGAFAAILHRTTMLQNVRDTFLARRGWVKEISAWVERLSKLASMSRAIESRISLEGLAMGGTLDTRINLVVLNQIAPALGILTEAPDGLILPKNCD